VKDRLYRWARGDAGKTAASPVQVGTIDLVTYLLRRGALPWLRGAIVRFRLRRCGGRLFVGRRVRLFFARQITAGRNVLIADDVYLNGLSRDGIRLGSDVRLREHVWIQATSTLDQPGVGLEIGDGTYIGPRCVLGAGGGIRIGRDVTFGAAVHVLAENHAFRDADLPISAQGVTRKGIVIDDGVWIGNAAIVLDGVTIGKGAVIGAGAVVTRDVAPYSIAAGNPARVIGHRETQPSRPAAV
jgi:acetyltransferase-like isoleucine patch superfamily enzyme